jgi:capsular exopolysaccharide synthesis family protein
MLGTNLRFYSLDKTLSIFLVTSPEPESGKSVIVANLAAAIAMSGLKVIIVDADLRRPRQHILFNLKSGEGLIGSLLDGESNDKLQGTRVENLSVLTSGKNLPPNPSELLGSRSMEELINHLPADTDLILIDSPPVLNIADTAALTSLVDGVLLVLAAGNTSTTAAQQALANLQHVGANMVGVVLNAVSTQIGPYNYYQEVSTPDSDGHGSRQYRRGKLISPAREWVQSKNILPSFLGWFQNIEIMPSIRGWFQSKR